MPQNTQMHTQWITVNGQSVPLVLPQYWDGEKWVVSSEQNPLPVKAELTEIEDGKLNVRDVDVKAELELMKQQQQQILDRLNQPVQTELTGSSLAEGEAIPTKNVKKAIVDTLLDAQTVNPNSWSTLKDIGYTSETDIWFAVNIDQQPWTLNTDIFTYHDLIQLSTPRGHGVYPPKNSESSVFTNTAYPSTSLWLGGIYLHSVFGLSMPTTVEEAFQSKTGYFKGARVGILNESENPATVTLKVIRVWR